MLLSTVVSITTALYLVLTSATDYYDHISTTTTVDVRLYEGDRLLSQTDGTYVRMQEDGNFVLRDPNKNALWSTETAGNSGSRFQLQPDGKLRLLIHASDVEIWDSETDGHSATAPHSLVVTNNCVYVMDKDNTVFWNQGTGCSAPYSTFNAPPSTWPLPSKMSTSNPTKYPTSFPTLSPTPYPATNTPATDPTIPTTNTPTNNPTLIPIKAPTFSDNTVATIIYHNSTLTNSSDIPSNVLISTDHPMIGSTEAMNASNISSPDIPISSMTTDTLHTSMSPITMDEEEDTKSVDKMILVIVSISVSILCCGVAIWMIFWRIFRLRKNDQDALNQLQKQYSNNTDNINKSGLNDKLKQSAHDTANITEVSDNKTPENIAVDEFEVIGDDQTAGNCITNYTDTINTNDEGK